MSEQETKAEPKTLIPVHECNHKDFRVNANVNVTRVNDEAPAEVIHANVSIWCKECGHFFDFENGIPYSRGIMLNMVVPEHASKAPATPKLYQGDEPRIEQ